MSTLATHGDEKCDSLMSHRRVVQMGILNLTPDSFSDGGLFNSTHSALEHALSLVAQGAHIIDVGGVSTRPGSLPVSHTEEWSRVHEVLKLLRLNLPNQILISLDTNSPEVALNAAEENLIDLINDVGAARIEASNLPPKKVAANQRDIWTTAHVAAHFKLGLVLMHMQGEPKNMQSNPTYENCSVEIANFLRERLHFSQSVGVRWCAIDPGIGFGKTLDHNLELLSQNAMTQLKALGAPILIGLSRKSFLKNLAERNGVYPDLKSPQEERDWRDQQSQMWEQSCVDWGAKIIRSHQIKDYN